MGLVTSGGLGSLVVIASLSSLTDLAFLFTHLGFLTALVVGLVTASRTGRERLRLVALGAVNCEAAFLVLSHLVLPGVVGS